jgi:hypothetical protein
MRPVPMQPILNTLDGASFPSTDDGTIVGAAIVAADTVDVCKKPRRVIGLVRMGASILIRVHDLSVISLRTSQAIYSPAARMDYQSVPQRHLLRRFKRHRFVVQQRSVDVAHHR